MRQRPAAEHQQVLLEVCLARVDQRGARKMSALLSNFVSGKSFRNKGKAPDMGLRRRYRPTAAPGVRLCSAPGGLRQRSAAENRQVLLRVRLARLDQRGALGGVKRAAAKGHKMSALLLNFVSDKSFRNKDKTPDMGMVLVTFTALQGHGGPSREAWLRFQGGLRQRPAAEHRQVFLRVCPARLDQRGALGGVSSPRPWVTS